MFKHVIKYTLAAVIWKKYRRLIVATVLLFIYWWIVNRLHGDFIAYAELKNSEQNIGLSFVVKWLLFGIGLAAYLGFSLVSFKPTKVPEPEKKPSRDETQTTTSQTTDTDNNLFDAVRDKPSLRSKSDMVIDKYPKKK